MHLKRLKMTGDTIVEVLIAITVVSVILSGAYTVSNHSFRNTEQAQEHSEVLKLIQGQLERIKIISTGSNANTLFSSPTFCIDPSGVTDNIILITGFCIFGPTGQYHITTAITPISATEYVFTTSAVWPSVVGSGNDTVVLRYKIDRYN